jgi:5-methylcytosine-specific restriction protein B
MEDLRQLLTERRYVVLQGPPGTGKTRLALRMLRDGYGRNGISIQFHPNTTYETFLGGLVPEPSSGSGGLQFTPRGGHLLDAVRDALASPEKPFLLHIDEINRADLSKVLGEAIFLFEREGERRIKLAYDFGAPVHRELELPPNFNVLGTMNTADRSLAIADIAVRRRFAYVDMWPEAAVVSELGGRLMREAFERLCSVFIEHASGHAFDLAPGHAYFLEEDDERAKRQLHVTVVPLLREYIAQGYVAGFADEISAYIQWIDTLS